MRYRSKKLVTTFMKAATRVETLCFGQNDHYFPSEGRLSDRCAES